MSSSILRMFLLLGVLSTLFAACRPIQMAIFYTSENHRRPKFKEDSIRPRADLADVFRFHEGNPQVSDQIANLRYKGQDLHTYLDAETQTTAFLVIRNDSLLYEGYFEGYDAQSRLPSFSVAKSFTSALVGIAVQQGFIKSVQDPVTDYLPELKPVDPHWSQLKIEHLLDMRSGIDFNEDTYVNPYSDIAHLYMSKNALRRVRKMKFAHEPGTYHYYSSGDTQILGLILERATGKSLSAYMEEQLWQPMGMESEARWHLDSRKQAHTKAFCCLQVVARDYARFGRLFLNGGNWQGQQLVDSAWVAKSVQPNFENDCYQYQWYSGGRAWVYEKNAEGKYQIKQFADSLSAFQAADSPYKLPSKNSEGKWRIRTCGPAFFALGVFGQEVYVHPQTQTIFVRLGKKWDTSNHSIFGLVLRELEEKKGD